MLTLYGAHLGIDFITFLDVGKAPTKRRRPSPSFGAQMPSTQMARAQMASAATGKKSLLSLVKASSVVTFEHEHVPADMLAVLARYRKVRPSARCLKTIQDRLLEKRFLQSLTIPTAPFAAIDSITSLHNFAAQSDYQCFLKKRVGGYDGKHQLHIKHPSDCKGSNLPKINKGEWIIEKQIDFKRELSLVAAASNHQTRSIRFFPMAENIHQEGILRSSSVMANHPLQSQAHRIAHKIIAHYKYQGVLCIEFFEYQNKLYVNELAPRVHNSGHWTIEGMSLNQFEAHSLGILGYPLPALTQRYRFIKMFNCISTMPERSAVLKIPGAHFHHYRKQEKKNRKLGHITVCAHDKGVFDKACKSVARLVR